MLPRILRGVGTRTPDPPPPDLAGLTALVRKQAQSNFADGVLTGYETVLTLALGKPCYGGIPYAGPELPDEFVFWCEAALRGIEKKRGEG